MKLRTIVAILAVTLLAVDLASAGDSPEKKREVWEDMKQIRDELFRLKF